MAKKEETSKKEKIIKIVSPKDIELKPEQKKVVSEKSYSQYIRALLQNWRQGTVKTKGRSEVSFSNKKPWKQKGTGRARAGSARSPLWRKGGVIFGPKKREKKLSIPSKLRSSVLRSLLWNYLDNKNVYLLSWDAGNAPKTSSAYSALVNAGIVNKNITLFVTESDQLVHFSFANIPNVRMLLFDQPNAYDLSNSDCWVILNNNMDDFKKMVEKWI